MREAIIAADFLRAMTYAATAGWHVAQGTNTFERPEGEAKITVEFVPTPEALLTITQGTPVHVGQFPGGMPAAWARALARHSVVADIGEDRAP